MPTLRLYALRKSNEKKHDTSAYFADKKKAKAERDLRNTSNPDTLWVVTAGPDNRNLHKDN